MKILLPVDGSPFTKKMLAYLGAHDEMFGLADEFVLIHVQSPVPPRARAAVIAKAAESGKFDLVVMGSHGHSALGALFMGSTAQRVLAKCSTPVLLIRQ